VQDQGGEVYYRNGEINRKNIKIQGYEISHYMINKCGGLWAKTQLDYASSFNPELALGNGSSWQWKLWFKEESIALAFMPGYKKIKINRALAHNKTSAMSYINIWLHFVFATKDRIPYLNDMIRKDVFDHIQQNA